VVAVDVILFGERRSMIDQNAPSGFLSPPRRLSRSTASEGGPKFRVIQAVSLTDRVITALKDAFFSGDLKPGDPIVERQLAREMKVGTPVIREALIALQGQGFVRRITNTGTFVTTFTANEVRDLYTLRVELEVLALQWARPRATAADLNQLSLLVDRLVEAGTKDSRREFLERDFAFHRYCWWLSGNAYLCDTLERLMAPLFTFAVLSSGLPVTEAMAREHYEIVDALRKLEDPEFTASVRKTLTGFASRWISAIAQDSDPSISHVADRPRHPR
jgi:DNA-binding GntR family transcriptional regulator